MTHASRSVKLVFIALLVLCQGLQALHFHEAAPRLAGHGTTVSAHSDRSPTFLLVPDAPRAHSDAPCMICWTVQNGSSAVPVLADALSTHAVLSSPPIPSAPYFHVYEQGPCRPRAPPVGA